jgi:hypothetical protein
MDLEEESARGSPVAGHFFGTFIALVGGALLVAPWWSTHLPADDYPLTTVLGVLFGAGGLMLAIPDRWPRLRALAFALMLTAFGTICAALALMPSHPDALGRLTIGGVPGFRGLVIPLWARLVAGIFAAILLAAGGAGLWGFARGLFDRVRD